MVHVRTHAPIISRRSWIILGFRKAKPRHLKALQTWLAERALEHDRPTFLLQMACEKLYCDKLVRPGITILERMVTRGRVQAQQDTFRLLAPVLTDGCKVLLDRLLVRDDALGCTPLAWLRHSATSNSATAILATLEKLAYLRRWGLEDWDLRALPPNRLKFLAQLGRKSTSQALQRTPEERRYPILVAFLQQSLLEITDEVIDLFDRCLAEAYARAGRDRDDFRSSVAQSTNEKVQLFRELARLVLDPTVGDAELRSTVYRRIPAEVLQRAVEESDHIIRPLDDSYFDFLASRYSYLRQFAPAFLDAFDFQSNVEPDPLLEAVRLLRRLNAEHRRTIPEDAPLSFVPAKWRTYVVDAQGAIDRHYYELCVLWELRGAFCAGNVWLRSSRRYANPESYLIARQRWPTLRPEVCRQIQAPESGLLRSNQCAEELEELLFEVDWLLPRAGKSAWTTASSWYRPLKRTTGQKVAVLLEQHIDERLPQVELSELLIEVDSWSQFTRCLEHAAGSEPRSRDLPRHLYASILAQGSNLGLTRMAQISDLAPDRLAWCTNWYLREETLKAAVNAVVNFHHRQPLSACWGGGTLSSSDGQRFPASGKVRNATALPRYFGYGKGVTFYTWTSDQFSQYGTKVIPATVRDATYVLDEILDNETELSIVEHTTDTSGYTEVLFALFDLLGMQFAPRIRDLGDQRLYRLDGAKVYPNLEPRLHGRINRDLILHRWDDLLRVAGSLKMGWVTASLFIGKLQSYPRQNALTRALQEYGRLIKTIFILRYLESEEYRRRINTQLNKGEALHALRRFLFFANEGTIRRKQKEEQTNQASCLNLLTNAVIAWNTVYMGAVLDQLKAEGYPINEADLGHLSPARYEHINPYGKYHFEVEGVFRGNRLRPLRQP